MTPPTIPTQIPAALTAGDSATWDDPSFTHPLYGSFDSASGWALAYEFIGPTTSITKNGATQDSGWRTSLLITDTTALKDLGSAEPDTVRWVARVSQASDLFTVADGVLQIFTPASVLASGVESQNKRMIGLIDAALEELVTSNIASFQLQGRAATKNDIPALLKLRTLYVTRLWREQHPGQFAPGIAAQFRCAR